MHYRWDDSRAGYLNKLDWRHHVHSTLGVEATKSELDGMYDQYATTHNDQLSLEDLKHMIKALQKAAMDLQVEENSDVKQLVSKLKAAVKIQKDYQAERSEELAMTEAKETTKRSRRRSVVDGLKRLSQRQISAANLKGGAQPGSAPGSEPPDREVKVSIVTPAGAPPRKPKKAGGTGGQTKGGEHGGKAQSPKQRAAELAAARAAAVRADRKPGGPKRKGGTGDASYVEPSTLPPKKRAPAETPPPVAPIEPEEEPDEEQASWIERTISRARMSIGGAMVKAGESMSRKSVFGDASRRSRAAEEEDADEGASGWVSKTLKRARTSVAGAMQAMRGSDSGPVWGSRSSLWGGRSSSPPPDNDSLEEQSVWGEPSRPLKRGSASAVRSEPQQVSV